MLRLLVLLLCLVACSSEPLIKTPIVIKAHDPNDPEKEIDVTIPAETLEKGRIAYTQYCRSCHGDNGDGKGPASVGMRPPPRDLRQGKFKFGAVASGSLPNDADLVRIIRRGLRGTAMLPWSDIPEDEVLAIVQYIKIFKAPGKEKSRWQEEAPGVPIVPTADPWSPRDEKEQAVLDLWKQKPSVMPSAEADKKVVERELQARERGAKIYHVVAQCVSCHPAYETKQKLTEWSLELMQSCQEFRADMYNPALKESDYQYPLPESQPSRASTQPVEQWGKLSILPTDFTTQVLRSGHTLQDLYRTIASGIGGTAMPSWKESLPDEELWAMVHYVAWLVELAENPDATALRALQERLQKQPTFAPPEACTPK